MDFSLPPPTRRIYCNRTLNLRSIEAIGFDMDYTLVHYKVRDWEERAYEHLRARLLTLGLPVEDLRFDPDFATLGLIVDAQLGNLVKANRFGYVKRACHGTQMLDFDGQRTAYERTTVDLGDSRWVFLNTLFGLSEACMYGQLVDLFDQKVLTNIPTYRSLYDLVRSSLDAAHMEGALKAEILASPEKFVELDPQVTTALLDLRNAGKKLVLITNSEWSYTNAMMKWVFEPSLKGQSWRSMFHLMIVGARKPAFFTEKMPAFEVLDDEGRLLPAQGALQENKVYLGGHARQIEASLQLRGEQILYVGDHIFSDVNISKSVNRWRTGLILRDLEDEIDALSSFETQQKLLTQWMNEKEVLEHRYSMMRIAVQRAEQGYAESDVDVQKTRQEMRDLRATLVSLDEKLGPLAKASGELVNKRWGLLLRTGNDKSHLARQIERHADVYTSRVSNLAYSTPFVYLRSPRGSLPHDY